MIQYISINHQNASLADREEFFKKIETLSVGPSVLLQTCNRVELYYGQGELPDDVIRHLFRVVCGLESAIMGEKAVQGQVKDAYQTARNSGVKLPTEIHKLFESALLIGKKVRTQTQISHGAVSHSLAALEIIKNQNIDFRLAKIAIVGVNKLTSDIIKFLKNKGAENIILVNRTLKHAQELASLYDIKYCGLDDISNVLANSDVVISATSSPNAVISKSDFRDNHKILCIDLAFPRDIQAEVSQIEGVKLYNLRDVEDLVKVNLSIREDEVAKAEKLIEEEIMNLKETLERRSNRTKSIRVIARTSKLSRIQVDEVFNRFPDVNHSVVFSESFGDKNLKISLLKGEAPDDMFTRELDLALINGEADIAIHSAKDLPEKLNPELEVIALYEAFDKTDSLVSVNNLKLSELKSGSKIGTSSPLRRKEILAIRPDVQIVDIRGCIEERVAQVRRGDIDAAIVATCALKRLNMENEIAQILPFATHPMQGRLAITAKKGREDLKEIFKKGNILQ